MKISAQDFFEITQLIQNFLHNGDFNRAEEAAQSFSEDGTQSYNGLQVEVSHAGEHTGGRPEIVDMVHELFRGTQGNCRHWAGLPLIKYTDEGVVAESYMMVLRVGQVPYAGVILTGVYHDYMRKNAAGEWEIWKRVASLDPAPEHSAKEPYDVLVVARDLAVGQYESVLVEATAIHAAGVKSGL
jgi:hypothetical protein